MKFCYYKERKTMPSRVTQKVSQNVNVVINAPPRRRRRRTRKSPPPPPPPRAPPQGGGGLEFNRFQTFKNDYFNADNVALAASAAPVVAPTLQLSVDRAVAVARAADAAINRSARTSSSSSSVSTWAPTPMSSPRDMSPMEAYFSPPSYRGSPLVDVADVYRRSQGLIPGAYSSSAPDHHFQGGATGSPAQAFAWVLPPQLPAFTAAFTTRAGVLRCNGCHHTRLKKDIGDDHRAGPQHTAVYMALRLSTDELNAQQNTALVSEEKWRRARGI
jgi:hypothetical protein